MARCPKDGRAVPCPALIVRPRTAPVACSSALQRDRWTPGLWPLEAVADRGYPHEKPTGRPAVVLQRQPPQLLRCSWHAQLTRWHGESWPESRIALLRPLSADRAPKASCECSVAGTEPISIRAKPAARAFDSSSLHHDSTMQPSSYQQAWQIQHSTAAMHLSGRSSRPLHLHVLSSSLFSLVCAHIILYRALRTLCVLSYYFRCKAISFCDRVT